MMGDSLMRYHYFSLIYFLRHGKLFDPSIGVNNIVHEFSFANPLHSSTWNEFFLQSSCMLYPNELCDCFCESNHFWASQEGMCQGEDQYYYEASYSNTVTYLQAFGHYGPIKGHLPVRDALWRKYSETLVNGTLTPFIWQYKTWHQTISNYVAMLHPKPHIVILNAGKWTTKFAEDKQLAILLKQSLIDVGIQGLWCTDTYAKNGKTKPEIVNIDDYLCQILPCWNVSWTRYIPDEYYWDRLHFFEPIYRLLNEEMLEQLGMLPNDYEHMTNPFASNA